MNFGLLMDSKYKTWSNDFSVYNFGFCYVGLVDYGFNFIHSGPSH
jgi:hypothetical protein